LIGGFGRPGHAPEQGENALTAVDDIQWIRNFRFKKRASGRNGTSVTVIDTENKQHNVVPAQCKYVIDVRVNELYSFEKSGSIKRNLKSSFKPRTTA
jgi:acetylornithine deacetylase